MRLIFFSFKASYRKMLFNNFLANKIYGKYFVLDLGGPIKYFIGKLLIFLKIGKAISCDGNPIIVDKSNGINFWSRTTLYIPKNLYNLNNNFAAIKNNHLQNNKHFQIYPININKTQIRNDLKIIFISRINIDTTLEEKNIWEKNKNQLMEDFRLIDDKEFWDKTILRSDDEFKKFNLYKKLKLLLRFDIVKNIKKNFNDKLDVIGNDWNSLSLNASPSPAIWSKSYNIKKIYNIYRGNICLDLGSIDGSVSLYHRSIQIIESGGLIIQSYQSDANEIWGDLKDKILFKNLSDLTSLINKLLADKRYCSFLLKEISNNFRNSKKTLEKNLDKIFEQ
jgi:hypothetical protein